LPDRYASRAHSDRKHPHDDPGRTRPQTTAPLANPGRKGGIMVDYSSNHSSDHDPDIATLPTMQRKILAAIRSFIHRQDMPPTVRELGQIFALKSSTVFAHLKALERKGFISRSPGKSRGIQLLGGIPQRGIPLLGRVPAGPLDLAVELQGDTIEVDPDFFGEGELFALKVRGDSMIEAGILDGDTVIVAKTDDALDGQIVVARVDDEATVKQLRRRPDAVVLQPANPAMDPLIYRPGDPEPQILGRVVGVLRKL
jgi:repressor LexA